jgi:hypothetical protein
MEIYRLLISSMFFIHAYRFHLCFAHVLEFTDGKSATGYYMLAARVKTSETFEIRLDFIISRG